ncbi:Acetyltransferase (GNAT) domain [Propionibacterium ruminifibrarum]|uniref:Acetyltransferase (GNAT) domain n=1 Tax=Propionibacterium ruminifibrarum TaxID=1962131 RepID=A0A375I0V7_9ACTN|nr:GNAT family protein [Propionibacterium ruminifibrarum]SPF68476.1 Acetyltransferase (GNAT) domain [Propionibacterium ruminifibrarum]
MTRSPDADHVGAATMAAGPGWPVVLHHDGLVLRPLRSRDAGQWTRLRAVNRDWTGPWDSTLPADSRETPLDFGQLVRRYRRAGREGSTFGWALALDETGRTSARALMNAPIIGQITVAGVTYGAAQQASIGYWIDKGHAGRGYTPRGVAMAADFCFGVVGLHRLEICIRPENGPSHRVVAKLGWRYEGLRQRYLHINGDWRDHDVYVRTAEERPANGELHRLLTRSLSPDWQPD